MQPSDRPPSFAARQLASELYKLYEDSTVSTYEGLAKKLPYSRKTVTEILQGKRLPSKAFITELVDICVADTNLHEHHINHFGALWEAARADQRDARNHNFPVIAPGTAGFQKSWLPATWYRNNSEFYSAAKEYVDAAQAHIRVTYIRHTPPTHVTTPQAESYFAAILDWARTPGHQVTRIIGMPTSDGKPPTPFVDWVRNHHDETVDIHNYEARIIRWTSRGDGLNMALFDADTAFLAVSGQPGGQNLTGFSIGDPQFTQYLIIYFDQLWHTLEPLGSFLENANLHD